MQDIAAKAGVAPMTVSRVINGAARVSPQMRKRVERAIEELDYHPNALARSLKSRRSRLIGILLPEIVNPFSAVLANSIEETLLQRGYSAFISTTGTSVQREQAALQTFFDHRVEGIIVATMDTPAGTEALQKFIRLGLACVVVGRESANCDADRVTIDHRGGAREAVEHLISLGHRRIGFIGASPESARRLGRFRGFEDALQTHNLAIDDSLIVGPGVESGPGYSTEDDGYTGMHRLLSFSNRPTAVFARNDFTAMGAIRAARDRGVQIPDGIAIAGFDNVPLAAYFTPPLTTVAQPTTEEGHAAASLLLERIEADAQRTYREVRFDCRLVVRQTTVKSPDEKCADPRGMPR